MSEQEALRLTPEQVAVMERKAADSAATSGWLVTVGAPALCADWRALHAALRDLLAAVDDSSPWNANRKFRVVNTTRVAFAAARHLLGEVERGG